MLRDTRRSSWNSFEGMDIEYFKQKEQKISALRMRKYFTGREIPIFRFSELFRVEIDVYKICLSQKQDRLCIQQAI